MSCCGEDVGVTDAEFNVGDQDIAFVVCIKDGQSGDSDSCLSYTIADTSEAMDLSQIWATPGFEAYFCFSKPDCSVVEVPATFATAPYGLGDGTDGCLMYRTPAGFFDQAGYWTFEVKVRMPPCVFSKGLQCFRIFDTIASVS